MWISIVDNLWGEVDNTRVMHIKKASYERYQSITGFPKLIELIQIIHLFEFIRFRYTDQYKIFGNRFIRVK